MRNSDEILYNLTIMSKKSNYVFEKVYKNLYNPNLYLTALGKIYSNKGSGTEGTDGKTVDGFGIEEINTIIKELKEESYQPKPSKRILIPKKNGKLRPLSIPSFRDRILQEVVRMLLESMYETQFSENSHGFRPNRSCHTALLRVKKWQGTKWFIEGDIKGCFDNINHNKLIEILRKRIKDEKFIRLIRKFLKNGYIEDWKYHRTHSGTPQGGIMSPILANIYLNELDKKVDEIIKVKQNIKNPKRIINPEYYKIESHYKLWKRKLKEQNYTYRKKEIGKEATLKKFKEYQNEMLSTPYYAYDKKGHLSIKYIRYADDFIIGVDGDKEICVEIKEELRLWLNNDLKLELSEEKTKITHSSKGIQFLGYNIKLNTSQATKYIKGGIKTRVWHGRLNLLMKENFARDFGIKEKLIKNVDAKEWIFLGKPGKTFMSDLEIMMFFRQIRDGLYNYYCLALNVSKVMRQVDHMLMNACLKTLAHKHSSSRTTELNKLRLPDKNWGVKYKTKEGEKILTWKKALVYKPTNYLCDDNISIYNNGLMGRTELEERLRANKCEWCGKRGRMEIHHIKKLSDLKGKTQFEKRMISRRRKTMILCKECHTDLHKGKLS